MSDDPEDRDLMAASYVLGVLDPDEARDVEMLAHEDHAVATSLDKWRNHLAPLAEAVPPVPPPPAVWERIEATLRMAPAPAPPPAPGPAPVPAVMAVNGPTPLVRAWRSARFWRASTAGALALAAAFAGVAFVGRPPAPEYETVLAPPNSPAPAFMATMEPDGSLLVRPLARVQMQPGKDMELWALPEGAQKPLSLGMLPAIGRRIAMRELPRAGTQLMVSLEPTGGSPTGAPTGPVLYAGSLTRLD